MIKIIQVLPVASFDSGLLKAIDAKSSLKSKMQFALSSSPFSNVVMPELSRLRCDLILVAS